MCLLSECICYARHITVTIQWVGMHYNHLLMGTLALATEHMRHLSHIVHSEKKELKWQNVCFRCNKIKPDR